MQTPHELAIINSFKCDFPQFVDALICDDPYNIALRLFRMRYVARVSKLEFECNPCDQDDEFFDATIYCNTGKGMIGHPVSINITKLLHKIEGRCTTSYSTERLVALVHPDEVQSFVPRWKSKNNIPPILLVGIGFGTQLVDGNHRVLHAHCSGSSEVSVIEATKEDLADCLECDGFSVIIEMFLELIRILKKDNPHELFLNHPLFWKP